MSGTLGSSNPAANTLTTVYTVAAGKTAVFNVSIANTGSGVMAVRLAISTSATPTTGEYIEYDTVLPGYSVLERGGLMASQNKNIVVYVTTGSAAVNVYGYEE